jgi:hypothetical protein
MEGVEIPATTTSINDQSFICVLTKFDGMLLPLTHGTTLLFLSTFNGNTRDNSTFYTTIQLP